MTEALAVAPRVHVAKVIVSEETSTNQVKMADKEEKPIAREKGRVTAKSRPVKKERENKTEEKNIARPDSSTFEQSSIDVPF